MMTIVQISDYFLRNEALGIQKIRDGGKTHATLWNQRAHEKKEAIIGKATDTSLTGLPPSRATNGLEGQKHLTQTPYVHLNFHKLDIYQPPEKPSNNRDKDVGSGIQILALLFSDCVTWETF